MIIAVVGIGLDGADGLAASVGKVIEQASVLAGSKRHLSYFSQHRGKKIDLTNLKTGIDEIADFAAKNCSIVVLASGDPLFFWLRKIIVSQF